MNASESICIGLDLGYGKGRYTGGVSFFSAARDGAVTSIGVAAETRAVATEEMKRFVDEDPSFENPALEVVAVDAPVTPERLPVRPRNGRSVDSRFSRGDFSNGMRGPQPGSIATPRPGWSLYEAGMDALTALARRDFPYLRMPSQPLDEPPQRVVVEVIPKLTQTLFLPRSLLVNRPSEANIDEWLFTSTFAAGGTAYRRGLEELLGPRVSLSASVFREGERILKLSRAAFHECVGAFVAGLQAALLSAKAASFVGSSGPHEGYFLLPLTWHADWERTWNATERTNELITVRRSRWLAR